ncbi:RNA polymerase sigma factor [Pseudomonas baetica]|uniref:RNA polymerase sigma factor n=1 Tax=Pseudomonas baetica TaxID=674054 RepID=UPI003EEBC81B
MPFDPVKPSLINTLVRHYDELVDHVRRRFGDRGFAREVVHDVCVQLLEKREKDNVHTPLALLRKISHDQAVSRYRSERRRQAWVVALPELPQAEVATRMGISLKTVEKHLRLGLAACRAHLERVACDEPEPAQ